MPIAGISILRLSPRATDLISTPITRLRGGSVKSRRLWAARSTFSLFRGVPISALMVGNTVRSYVLSRPLVHNTDYDHVLKSANHEIIQTVRIWLVHVLGGI